MQNGHSGEHDQKEHKLFLRGEQFPGPVPMSEVADGLIAIGLFWRRAARQRCRSGFPRAGQRRWAWAASSGPGRLSGARRPETILGLSRAGALASRAGKRQAKPPGKAGAAAKGDSRRTSALGGKAPAQPPAFPRAHTHRAGSLQRWRRQRQEPGIQNGDGGTKAPIPQAEEFCGRHLLAYLRLDAAVTR